MDSCRDGLALDVKISLLSAGLIFLLALVLGVWKYRQVLTSEDHRAHPYVDIAHRAALLYSLRRCWSRCSSNSARGRCGST